MSWICSCIYATWCLCQSNIITNHHVFRPPFVNDKSYINRTRFDMSTLFLENKPFGMNTHILKNQGSVSIQPLIFTTTYVVCVKLTRLVSCLFFQLFNRIFIFFGWYFGRQEPTAYRNSNQYDIESEFPNFIFREMFIQNTK